MPAGFGRLFSPLRVGGVTFRNRLVMPPLSSGTAGTGGEVTDRLLRFYDRRAAGGVGAVIVEPGVVSPFGRLFERSMGIWSEVHLPGLQRLSGTLKSRGAAVLIQLCHAGPRAPSKANAGLQPVGPSGVPFVLEEPPRALTPGEIEEIKADFLAGALRARSAGFDGVELHAAHFYLLSSFLSGFTNRRDDDYGGSGRTRIVVDLIRMIKEAAGPDFLVSVRFHGAEAADGGITPDEAGRLAVAFQDAGADLLHVSAFTLTAPDLEKHFAVPAVAAPRPEHPAGAFLPLAANVRRASRLPVAAVGKINSPELAEEALAKGWCDLAAVGRPLIADPGLPDKWRRGLEVDECDQCNTCLLSLRKGGLKCRVNKHPY